MPSVAMAEEDVELMGRLRANDAFIRSAIDLIPIDSWGFDGAIKDRLKQRKHRLINEKLTQPQKRRLSNAVKQRLSKAQSDVCRTVTEVWDWMASTNLTVNTPKSQFTSKKDLVASWKSQPPATSSGSSAVNSKEQSDSSKQTNAQSQKRKRKHDASKPAALSSDNSNELLNPLSTRQDAMKKLHAKIEEFQAKRRGTKSAVDFEEKKRLQRRLSKMKLKDRRKEEKTAAKQQKDSKADGDNKKSPTPKKPRVEQKPITTTDDGKLVFSKFDFVVKPQNPDKKEAKKEKRKANRDKLSGKDYKRLLEKVEKRKEKIESIREKDADKADRLEQNIKWNSALQRAEGLKVKDNPELLKKGLKRKEQMKTKSKKKWAQREQTVAHDKEKRQQKRETNIAQRKQTVKKKKIDRARKRGRNV